jgi:tetraprenyl-beta-curcumene synthase
VVVRCRRGLLCAGVFFRAAAVYLLELSPQVKREVERWRQRAETIPDRRLARLALSTQAGERGHLEGAAVFALLAPRARRRDVIRAAIAFQALYDFLDTLAELPVRDPVANGRRLHAALIAAVDPARAHEAYLEHSGFVAGDGGYVGDLIDACRDAIARLPSYTLVADLCIEAAVRMAEYQSFNHDPDDHERNALRRWAVALTPSGSGLLWWETAAGAADSLGVFALLAAAARPSLSAGEAQKAVAAYFPWVGALNVMLDSLVDREVDRHSGDHSLVSHYDAPLQAAERLTTIAVESAARVETLGERACHSLILAAMASYYLARPGARTPDTGPIVDGVLSALGPHAGPTMAILIVRGAVARVLESQVVDFPLACIRNRWE